MEEILRQANMRLYYAEFSLVYLYRPWVAEEKARARLTRKKPGDPP